MLHKLVVIIKGQAFAYEAKLPESTCGGYVLPEGHHSAGWVERVWGLDWNELPKFTGNVEFLDKMQRIGKIY